MPIYQKVISLIFVSIFLVACQTAPLIPINGIAAGVLSDTGTVLTTENSGQPIKNKQSKRNDYFIKILKINGHPIRLASNESSCKNNCDAFDSVVIQPGPVHVLFGIKQKSYSGSGHAKAQLFFTAEEGKKYVMAFSRDKNGKIYFISEMVKVVEKNAKN
ncbi:hypothetical protein H0A36_27795 [Endozoicomonas sp. SM1973]|uniref:Lipoprotein n=1 Tax=Spartinivicinus marinus TaxID=2994442 RepID=A0A853IA76_9GAMM|nr:hypothetical protein [Spartinivicinus marinus]MCX4030474.1 hypothetical protein [Spartinivicinus marinus]NYZ69819.1 hypothetical protein [Spartinivicinus marinus]